MRRAVLAALGLCAAAAPALADTITEAVSSNGTVAQGPYFVTGPLFDGSLGTLTGVSITFQGSFAGDVFINTGANPPLQVGATLYDNFGVPGQSSTVNLGNFTLTTNGSGFYTGLAGYNFTETVDNIGQYVQGAPNAANFLAELGLYDVVHEGGVQDDFSAFMDKLTITYTYAVPEPASLAVLGAGALILVAARRKTRASRAA